MGALAELQELSGGRVFVVDDRGRGLRASWHLEHGLANLSIWRGERCVETFHLSIPDAARLAGFLVQGLGQAAGGASASSARRGPTARRATHIYEFETPSEARAAVDALLELVQQDRAAVMPHGRPDAVITPPDESHLVTAVGVMADQDRVTAVQIDAVERIDPDPLDALLNATAAQFDPK